MLRVGQRRALDKPSLDSMSSADIAALNWYYKVELKPNAFTNGTLRPNMTATRTLLERIDFERMRVLDIGAQEGVFGVLLSRAGADVTGYDRFDLSDKIDLIQEAYGTRFRYFGGSPFPDFVRKMHAEEPLFDGIFFSGVLYHVLAPTLFVYFVRTLLRVGGILVLETIAAVDSDTALYFNGDARYWNGTGSYYLPSTGWLDYYLRFLGFKILDVEYTTKRQRGDKLTTRVAMTAVLTDEHPTKSDDRFGRHLPQELIDFQPLKKDKPFLGSERRITVPSYADSLYHREIKPRTIDVTRIVHEKGQAPADERLRMLRLSD